MAKTVVGLFDTTSEAQDVVKDLISKGFRQKDISVVANDTNNSEVTSGNDGNGEEHKGNHAGEGAGAGAIAGTVIGGGLGLILSVLGATAIPVIGPIVAAGPIIAALTGAGVGAAAGGLIGALTGAGVPDEDAQYYAEGVHRGGTLVTVNSSDADAQTAYDVMQDHGAVDIDERGSQYKESGWTGYNPEAKPYSAQEVETYRSSVAAAPKNVAATSTNAAPVEVRQLDQGEAVVPVVEEELQVGKRQVQRGGVRIYTTVEEKPVEEQVQLREEQVRVERRQVDRPVSDADLATFKEGTIEVKTTAEEAVVSKQARVVEEVVVDKTVAEKAEIIRDTVRRTDVQVERVDAPAVNANVTTDVGTGTSVSTSDFSAYDTDFRNNFHTTYGSLGNATYEQYAPNYRYGYNLSSDKRYAGKDWNSIQSQVRQGWESKNPGGKWDDFKDSIKYAWDKATGR